MNLDADDETWVPLIRKIKASEIMRNSAMAHTMLWLLADAAYFDRTETVKAYDKTSTVKLTMGESFVNIQELAAHFRMSEQKLRRALKRLEERETITTEKVYGGFKVKLVNVGRYWIDRAEYEEHHDMTVKQDLEGPVTQLRPNLGRASGNGGDGTCNDPDTTPVSSTKISPAEGLISQGLPAPLTIKQSSITHACTTNTRSTTPEAEGRSVGEGEKGQLDLIAPDRMGLVTQDNEIEVSGFFAAKDEEQWKALEGNGKWIHAMVTAHPDVTFILQELAHYYQWWIENPKKRRTNLAASIGNWLRSASKPRPSRNSPVSHKVPTEPGKYDGIGVTYSEFEE